MRLRQIDSLRAVAVLLVVAGHVTWHPLLYRIGWSGVYLFFVLSGYLISGLLFREYKSTGRIRLSRFLIRRGLKIYPAYYLLILATAVYYGREIPWPHVLADLLFAQGYFRGTWGHFWSLAVEEHFYILLPLTLVLLLSRNRSSSDPFHRLPWIFGATAITCLGFRSVPALAGVPYDFYRHVAPTHLHLDALGFGVLLGYLQEFRRPVLDRLFRDGGRTVLSLSSLLLLPVFLFDRQHPFMISIGESLVYVGFGGVLMFCMRKSKGVKGLCWIGECSYSIYLIHMPVACWSLAVLQPRLGRDWTYFSYVALSLGFGFVLSKLVEIPVLRLRERYFPAKEGSSMGRSRTHSAPQGAILAN